MAGPNPGFGIEEVPDNVVQMPQADVGQRAMVSGILMGLKALSQGAMIALGTIATTVFSLLTVASAFYVWISIPKPDNYQLASLAMYGMFILAANVIVRRK